MKAPEKLSDVLLLRVGFELVTQWWAAAFCSYFLTLSGLLGAIEKCNESTAPLFGGLFRCGRWKKEPGSAFVNLRGRGAWKVSFLGKSTGNAAWGKIKQSSFSSLLAWSGCVMSRWSSAKDYGIFFFLFFWGVGLGRLVYLFFFFKSLKQCCFPFLEAIVPGAADSLPSHSSLSWEALSWWCMGSALVSGLLSFVLLRSLFLCIFCQDPHHRVHKNSCSSADELTLKQLLPARDMGLQSLSGFIVQLDFFLQVDVVSSWGLLFSLRKS